VVGMAIRVALGEDNALLRDSIGRVIATEDGMDLVGTAEDYDSVLSLVERERPDVLVTDIRMPPSNTDEGIRVAAELRRRQPGVGVVVLSQHAHPAYAMSLLEQGSAGRAYLLKERVGEIDELLHAIREVVAGRSMIDPEIVDLLVTGGRAPASALERLTPREREVLAEMASGKNNAAIARTLVLSDGAVEKHINSVFLKLGVTFEPDGNRRVMAVLRWLSERG
jgi:DNA-binding NarL/FixJ family response regulator